MRLLFWFVLRGELNLSLYPLLFVVAVSALPALLLLLLLRLLLLLLLQRLQRLLSASNGAAPPPLGIQRCELSLQLVLLQLDPVLKLKPALKVVQPRRRRDMQQLLLNSTRLQKKKTITPTQIISTMNKIKNSQDTKKKNLTTCSRSSYVAQRLVYASRILDLTAWRSSIVRYILQSCIGDAAAEDVETLLVAAPTAPIAGALKPWGPPPTFPCGPLGRLYAPELVTARSICGGFVLGVAWRTGGIEAMPTPRPPPAPPLSVRLSDGIVVVAPTALLGPPPCSFMGARFIASSYP